MLYGKERLIFISLTFLAMFVGTLNGSVFNRTLLAEQLKVQNLSEAVLDILHKSLPEMRRKRLPVFNIFAYSVEPSHLQFFKDTMQKILRGLTNEISVRVGVNQAMYTDRLRHDAVILVDTVEALNLIYENFSRLHLKANYFYIIILHTFQPYFYDELLEILAQSWLNGIVNANVLVHALWNSILLYTSFPYTEYHCASTAPALQNRFENHNWQHEVETFFPYKVGNLYGCRLICATWEDMPYLKITPTEFQGIEGRLLNYMEENLNFKVKIRYMSDEQIERTITDERGVFDELFSTGTDFVVGAFPFKPLYLYTSYAPTIGYYLSDLYIFINGKREPFSNFAKLLFPFFYDIWALLILIFLLGALISTIAEKHKQTTRSFIIGSHNYAPIYNMFIVGLGGNISRPPRRNFARFLLFMWLLAALVMRGAYQALMFHFIRTDVAQDPPDTIREVLEQNYQIFMSESVFNAIEKLPEIRAAARLLNGSEFENFHKLNVAYEKVAKLAPYEYYVYYKEMQEQPPNVHVVREKIFTQLLSMYMRKNSVMLNNFNKQISSYYHYGIGQKLVKQHMRNKFEENSLTIESSALEQVDIEEMFGVFQLLLFGYVICIFVFFLEVVLSKFVNRKKKIAW